jgi:hypothetical protein
MFYYFLNFFFTFAAFYGFTDQSCWRIGPGFDAFPTVFRAFPCATTKNGSNSNPFPFSPLQYYLAHIQQGIALLLQLPLVPFNAAKIVDGIQESAMKYDLILPSI